MAVATASSIGMGYPTMRSADLGFRLFWTLSAGPRLSLLGDADATIEGDASQGFVIAASQNAEAIEVVIPNGVEASKVTVKVPPTVKTVKTNGATLKVVYTSYDITEDLDFSAAALAALAATSLSAADIYVSLSTGKNKSAGSKEAPLKHLWKALEKAETGDDHDAVRHELFLSKGLCIRAFA